MRPGSLALRVVQRLRVHRERSRDQVVWCVVGTPPWSCASGPVISDQTLTLSSIRTPRAAGGHAHMHDYHSSYACNTKALRTKQVGQVHGQSPVACEPRIGQCLARRFPIKVHGRSQLQQEQQQLYPPAINQDAAASCQQQRPQKQLLSSDHSEPTIDGWWPWSGRFAGENPITLKP